MINPNASQQSKPHTHPRGMTLVEVLAVVVILGLIAATLVYSFGGQVGRARRELAKSGIAAIVQALETHAIETGAYPEMGDGLIALTRPISGRATPLLQPDKLIDPWDNPYQYIVPGPNSAPYQVVSYGSDGAPGGEPGTDAADILSDQLRDTANHNAP
ncbi:MAG: type II secretion system protein GspG [Phycisphaerales bacterium]